MTVDAAIPRAAIRACAVVVVAVAALLAAPLQARAQSGAAEIADALRSDPVHVDRDARPTLSAVEAGRVRLRILDRNIGRIKVAVLPERLADEAGGIAELANAIDRELATPGTLIVSAGPSLYAVTSYPQVDRVIEALRRAVEESRGAGLEAQLLAAVDRIARVDPGPAGDGAAPPGFPAAPAGQAAGDDFLDGVLDTLRVIGFAVVALIALPLLFFACRGLWRWGRRRREATDELGMARGRAREGLLALGDEIRALDLDVSMPGADPAGVAEYEHALARYEEVSRTLESADTPRRVELATWALADGRRRIEAAKARLASPPAGVGGRPHGL